MKIYFSLLTLFLLNGCVTSPTETATKINNLKPSQVLSRDKAAMNSPAFTLKFNERTGSELRENDPVYLIDGKTNERSYFKVITFTAKSAEQILEVHTQAHKGWGFGSVSMIYPHVEFYDANGKNIQKDVKTLYFGQASTFMDGEYLRSVYRLTNLKPETQYRVLVGAQTSMTGKSMGSATNYAAAGAGIAMQNGIQASPVGPFWVLQTDSFKR